MLSSKIDFLGKFNELISLAMESGSYFPDKLCEFLVSEYELQAVVLFKVTNNNSLEALGRAGGAKKSFTRNSNHDCSVCQNLIASASNVKFNIQTDCQIPATDFVMYEGCLNIDITETEKVLFKIAKQTAFTKSETDNIEIIGKSLKNLLKIWLSEGGNIRNSIASTISGIAQELRTPTNSIMGFASLLSEESLSSSQTEYVSTLKNNAFELLSLINDLIDISKIESGLTKISYQEINLADLLNEVTTIFNEKLSNRNVEFLTRVDDAAPRTVKVDSQKLRYILTSLVTNSLRMTESGKITISVSSDSKDKIAFTITDTSDGIDSSKVSSFFTPFSLTDAYKDKIGNITGLSLLLAKKYIENLGGEIQLSSSMGKGVNCKFTIKTEASSSIEEKISSLPKPTGKKNKVLVVEDDYATSKLLSNYLNKWGYEPKIVNSANQALETLENESFLAILMDIVLPDANGLEVLKQIRENKNTKQTPVIICSVEAEQQKAFLMGAVEYFVKPINYKYLVEVLTSYKLKKDSNILIVDDDVPTLNLIKEAVDQSGYNAVAEAHSMQVMDRIENVDLDLAIIDLDMPELNGFDLIKMIKSNEKFSKLPIIIYTGKENYQEDLKKIDGLFEDLLEKSSSNIEDLADTINGMINRYDEPSTPEEVMRNTDAVKILLVEDYKHSQIIVTRLLKKNDFESIVVVENGQEALEQVTKQKYDLILMDMQMPVMNGFEATQKIREIDDYKDTPIIALTAFAMKGDREKCLDAGATDYIPKPIDSQEFINKVKYYTESRTGVRQKV